MKKTYIFVILGFVALLAYLATSIVESTDNSNPSPSKYITNNQTKNISYVKEYSLPKNMMPNGILVDKNGMVWIPDTKKPILVKFDPNKGRIIESYKIESDRKTSTEYTSDRMVWSIKENIDGSIWFSHSGDDPLWRFEPTTGKFDVFDSPSYAPFQMKIDPMRGDIWYTTLQKDKVGVIQKTVQGNFKISEFDIGENTYPSGIFLDTMSDSVWVSQIETSKITKFSIIRDENGSVQNITKIFEIPESSTKRIVSPTDVLVVNDTIWTTEHGPSFISSYNFTSKEWKRYPTHPIEFGASSLPFWLRASADQKGIWFNEHTGNRIGFLNLTDSSLTEYEVKKPDNGFLVQLLNIADDPTNSSQVWFSAWNDEKIGVVTNKLPLPFDIILDRNKIKMDSENNQNKTITFQIYKNDSFGEEGNYGIYDTLDFKAASSIGVAGELVNMTSSFYPDHIDLNKLEDAKVTLTLRNQNATKGNYTLLVGASNGQVTKSVFLDLEIK